MAFKISREQRKRIDALDTAMRTAHEKVTEAITAFNGTVSDLNGYLELIADEMQSEYDNKSERWHEGEKAMPTEEWIESLRVSIEEASDVDAPDELGFSDEPTYE